MAKKVDQFVKKLIICLSTGSFGRLDLGGGGVKRADGKKVVSEINLRWKFFFWLENKVVAKTKFVKMLFQDSFQQLYFLVNNLLKGP